MDSIKLMMEEHQYILRMLTVVRKACLLIMKGQAIDYNDFEQMIDFIRNYSDVHHHGKEEKLLFNEMVEHLGNLGSKMVNQGMLVEHDMGRLYIQELVSSLERTKQGDDESRIDVIANAISYTHHMVRHINKEDQVIYTFAMKQLPEEILNKVNQDTLIFENTANEKGVQKRYISLLEDLEKKYLN
ncbi:MAG: hemerythrin domain-containing protein [Clostridiales bacterium]|jgi:hemerythrin-like domain-containing protein|nr:hemerythrin domain-containing protein [Clostridiales bacterium]